ncbi:MAG: phosphatase PAP2 family protein [Algoriphagus sp.]|uniref:phosphatase PAP2 family protein n=1 Tax=Algoriphagus sp. TaxID=1872435 RepID=UPI0027302D3F|nr:phosphatase PAP2 family protein [Algoriphagus sp.]MDP2042751.1 phosphatase PAP2 family protein [Algoriphagus sp.]MDP3470873.1 phosphatase PAP2 family protein [Algoriphagus sp.]
MKIQLRYLFLFTSLSALTVSCMEELPTRLEYEGYEYAELDENAGTWNLILMAGKEQVSIPDPAAVGSAALNQQLQEVKSKIANSTAAQRESVNYWTNNSLLRWNEIALDLSVKYNLIPGPNPDGTYTLPNPANPAATPNFPFAHPPYISRMLAYLSVAQYDGLITAWHYKKKFGRPAPYKLDPQIKSAYEENGLNSYPSDGAVVAITSRDILSVMFPLEKEYLNKLAEEHLESLVLAGINVSSDIEAGKIIGNEVSKIALARANTDGMKSAQTPKSVSDSIKNAAFQRFGWKWENMESPQRPVGLTPLFGKVKMWNVPTVEEVRPRVPPAPGSEEFNRDAEELKRFAAKLTTEQRRIANFWNDGINTYSPPGHWNRFAKEAVVKYRLSPIRTARVFAYMNMAIVDAGISCWDAKYFYHYPRPIQTIPGFKTILGTPNFPAYTSGHSTFSAAASEVLAHFFPSDATKFRKWADEAAMSRIYGGIHYRFDAEEGLAQGRAVAAFAVAKAKRDQVD